MKNGKVRMKLGKEGADAFQNPVQKILDDFIENCGSTDDGVSV